MEYAGGQQLTITTEDSLYRDLRPGGAVRVWFVDTWSGPLSVLNAQKDPQADVTTPTIATKGIIASVDSEVIPCPKSI